MKLMTFDKTGDRERLEREGGTHLMRRAHRGRFIWMPVSVRKENGRFLATSKKGTLELDCSESLFKALEDKHMLAEVTDKLSFVSAYEM